MKLTKKQFNKLVAFADKTFSWDNKWPDDKTMMFFDYERRITVYISATSYTYLSIKKNDKYIYHGIVHTFHEINMFKHMVECLG